MKTSTPSRLSRIIDEALFSERVCLTITSLFTAAAFIASLSGYPRVCALLVAVELPWFIKALYK